MGLILSIETAITVCSVAVHMKGKLLGALELHLENIHGSKLVPLIQSLMKNLDLRSAQLDAIAVSQGPGSYTGLRIGVATAKGLAFAHDLPLIGVDSLDALARQMTGIIHSEDFIIPMIDARRMEVYAKVLDGNFHTLEALKPKVLDEASFREFTDKGKTYFLGNANFKLEGLNPSPNAVLISKLNHAVTVGEIAYEKYLAGDFEDLAYFEPNYLKEFMVMKPKKNLLLS